MSLIAQISDTHFGTEVPAVLAALHSALRELEPDVLLLCGDITQRGRHGQFAVAAEFFKSLPAAHRIAIPGNHDIPLINVFNRAFAPYVDYEQAFGAREHVWLGDDVAIVAFDATDPRRHKDGKLDTAHIAPILEKARPQADGRPLIVCAHQPLHTTWKEDRNQVLIGAETTAAVLAQQGADIVLSGHVHVPMIMTTAVPFPGLSRPFVLSGSGTAISHRTRRGVPNSFNTLRVETRSETSSVTVTQHDFKAATQTFEVVRKVIFDLGSSGWRASEAVTEVRETGRQAQ